MNIIFRVDSSKVIGTGHLMRCLTLASYLRSHGATCFFVCRNHVGNINKIIENHFHKIITLPAKANLSLHEEPEPTSNYDNWLGTNWETDANETINAIKDLHPHWLIIDHYGIDIRWETQVRPLCKRIFVIDDLANREHDCDIFLDQNLHPQGETTYQKLLPKHCKSLIGPKHILISEEFSSIKTPEPALEVRHIFVYFGSNDITNQAGKAISALNLTTGLTAEIVLGRNHPYKKDLLPLGNSRISIVENINQMAKHMAKADLSLGACGTTAWERCALGLPSIICITANNQKENAESLHKTGAAILIGNSDKVSADDWLNQINLIKKDTTQLKKMRSKSLELVSGHQKNISFLISQLMKDHI